jgi:hypothetical protein
MYPRQEAWTEAVARKEDELVTFFRKRKEGAAKIASQSREKGGPSLLTYWHFAAKARPYAEVISALRSGKDAKWFRTRFQEHLRSLGGAVRQHDFQKAMGVLEVWGKFWRRSGEEEAREWA